MLRAQIFIVHENAGRRQEAALLLKAQGHLHVIHQMSSVHECLVRVGHINCDLILVSATLPNNDVRKLLKHVRQQNLPVKVIVTDVPNDPKEILTYIAAGAAGYVLAQEGVAAWAKQIDAVYSGPPPGFAAHGGSDDGPSQPFEPVSGGTMPQPQRYANLTKREHEILTLLGKGHANQAIADQLIITVGTVKNHVHQVLTKLNLSNRKAAGIYLAFVK